MKKSETIYSINESDEDDLIIDFDVLCRLLISTRLHDHFSERLATNPRS